MTSDLNLLFRYFPQLTAHQQEQFTALGPLYEEWNARINVISRKDLGELYLRHVLHSLAIACIPLSDSYCHSERGTEHRQGIYSDLFAPGARVLDIGTGGGFPAVPLAILFPEARFTAVDSIGKKIKVVEEVVKGIGIQNLTPLNARAENVPGRFDYIVSRAVAPAATLLDWGFPKIEKGRKGTFPNGAFLLKGGDLTDELAATKRPCTRWPISECFAEVFFATKKVVYFAK